MFEISAKIIQHSKCARTGKEIITWEWTYPRMIHSEVMTHRMFSRNAASSRAIPITKVIEQVRKSPAKPSHWGKNQPGMQAREELTGRDLEYVQMYWERAAEDAAGYAEAMAKCGAHKQVANRILEPFQWMKVVVTYTEGENFFWLRNHADADPTLQAVSSAALKALESSTPFAIHPGEWHVPYVQRVRDAGGIRYLTDVEVEGEDEPVHQWLTLEEALAVSSSCCAQVSYRTLDLSLDKAKMIYGRLVESEPVHASPFEHQGTPMDESGEFWDEDGDYYVNLLSDPDTWQEGITHVDREGNFWSGNFQGFIQHRQLIPNNVKRG